MFCSSLIANDKSHLLKGDWLKGHLLEVARNKRLARNHRWKSKNAP